MRMIDYAKAATKEQRNDVWDSFDKRKKAKLGHAAANEEVGEANMFAAAAGMAAE